MRWEDADGEQDFSDCEPPLLVRRLTASTRYTNISVTEIFDLLSFFFLPMEK